MARLSMVRALLHRIGRHEFGSVLSLLAVALGTWVFAELVDELREGETQGIDQTILLALRSRGDVADPIGPPWLEEIGRDLTALGGIAVLTLITVGVTGYLLLSGKARAAAFVTGSVLSAVAVMLALKHVIARPRPDLVPHMSHTLTTSFPSGHSMLSAAVYLTLGALLARLHASLVIKAYILLCASVLAFLVGVSRVYVGVHWPSDVLGGWAAGAVWAAACWLAARALQRRGRVEPPTA